jgi:hypothetical protein
MTASHNEAIDRLYQVPLDEFTAARNALAKDAGARAPEIRKLEKPNLAAWAVNQLYWRARKTYDELIESAEGLRAEQRKQLGGKSANVTIAEARHKGVIQKAKQAAREFLGSTSAASDPVLTAISETLDALPGGDPPGRLTKPIRRVGFGALEGLAIVVPPKKVKAQETPQKEASKAEERARAMLQERLRFAEAAEREAEAGVERARRALERAEGVVERITGELDEAASAAKSLKKKVADAEGALAKTAKERERLAKGLGL